jgi:hypothetical protein
VSGCRQHAIGFIVFGTVLLGVKALVMKTDGSRPCKGGGIVNILKGSIGLLAVLAGITLNGFAFANHGGGGGHSGGSGAGAGGHSGYSGYYGHGGFRGYGWGGYYGAPLFWGGYDALPYNYEFYAPEFAAPMISPGYTGESVAPAAPPQSAWWYYCDNPQGYYPYVQQCMSHWQRVSPQPPGVSH